MIQLSEEWFAARLGKVTASRVIDILPGARGYKASRKNYLFELICERLTGRQADGFESTAMKHGTDTEPIARSAYEAITGNVVEEVGFIDHPTIKNFGASPDGLIGTDGGLEIKCPNTATHVDLLLGGKIQPQYIVQMHVGMMCTGRDWWDFVDYDDRLPDELAYFHKRIEKDEVLVAEIVQEVTLFLAEVDAMESNLREKMGEKI